MAQTLCRNAPVPSLLRGSESGVIGKKASKFSFDRYDICGVIDPEIQQQQKIIKQQIEQIELLQNTDTQQTIDIVRQQYHRSA